jgi:hypothetical protein
MARRLSENTKTYCGNTLLARFSVHYVQHIHVLYPFGAYAKIDPVDFFVK